MSEIFYTDRWAKRAAEIYQQFAKRPFDMPSLFTCVRCGVKTSNVVQYKDGPQCAEYFECSGRMDVVELTRIPDFQILHRNCSCANGGYVADAMDASMDCRECWKPFGFGVPIVREDGRLWRHLSCEIAASNRGAMARSADA